MDGATVAQHDAQDHGREQRVGDKRRPQRQGILFVETAEDCADGHHVSELPGNGDFKAVARQCPPEGDRRARSFRDDKVMVALAWRCSVAGLLPGRQERGENRGRHAHGVGKRRLFPQPVICPTTPRGTVAAARPR